MPAPAGRSRVHAILVVRPDGRTPASAHLKRTLAALDSQSRPVDALTIVACGEDDLVAARVASTSAGSLRLPASTSYAEAVRLASDGLAEDEAVWLLAQDTAPEPAALELLAGTLELSESVSIAAPKLVRWDDRAEIASLGATMTRLGRTVTLAEGELDQGQHDADEDVMGADVRGMLVRAGVWRELDGIDRALAGADEGLDLGARARLAGGRVAVVPAARVAVNGDGVAGLPDPRDSKRVRRIAYATRTAQLHRRFAYARALALPFVWLATLPLSVLRTVGHFAAKAPGLIGPEWAASATAFARFGAIAASRRRIKGIRRVPWSRLRELRLGRFELHKRLDTVDPDAGVRRRGELRFFAGGGAWAVLGGLVASIAVFTPLLAWPVLGGGGMLPLSDSVVELWRNAGWGLRATGVRTVGPADPFGAVLAVIGSLSPAHPSTALVVLWVLALPLAVLGGWFAATRITERSSLRIAGGAAWALAPTLLASLQQGRPGPVIAHLLLPWLVYAGSVAHRSWVAAAAASLCFAGVAAAAPSLAPALVLLWLVAVALFAVARAGIGLVRVVWIVVPAAVLAAPLVWRQATTGRALALLADPGVPWSGTQAAADPTGRAALATGFPTADPGGWAALLGDGASTWWVPLLLAPLAILALLAPVTRRWRGGCTLVAVALAGMGTAFASVGISVSSAQSQAIPLWPGCGLSLAWLGVVGAALTTLDAGRIEPSAALRPAVVRPVAVAVVLVALAALSFPALSGVHREKALLTSGPSTTLPAYVAAEGRTDPDIGTLVITPQDGGGMASTIVWGPSETLDGQSTYLASRTAPTAADQRLAELTADLVASSASETMDELIADGVSFVLVAPAPEPESERARAARVRAVTGIDQRQQLVSVGETTRGTLWRAVSEPGERARPTARQSALGGWATAAQLAVFTIAVLLAIPTTASRRAARRTPRIVGLDPGGET
ncbi:MAG: glycosyltransferase [Microbacterium sp.]|uniref:glycosyltransferase n=1 Tax=Microbacterium sp. TaxID=51671 RepID=UPI0039E4874E